MRRFHRYLQRLSTPVLAILAGVLGGALVLLIGLAKGIDVGIALADAIAIGLLCAGTEVLQRRPVGRRR